MEGGRSDRRGNILERTKVSGSPFIWRGTEPVCGREKTRNNLHLIPEEEDTREKGNQGKLKRKRKRPRQNTEEKGENILKFGFWNMAGLYNKDRQFWDYIKSFDYIGLIETWVDEKQWNKIKENMPDAFNWKCQYAKKEKTRGRASGGIITGVKKRIKEIEVREETEDIQERRIKIEDKTWKILAIYSREMKRTRKKNRKNNRQDGRRKNNNRRRLECKNGKGRPIF